MVNIQPKIKPVVLVILDGWGVAPPSKGNAIELAKKPTFVSLKQKYPYTELCAHGECAGLPSGQDGNSEAGHLNLGTGRVVKDDAVYISEGIKDGTFFKNPIFLEGINHYRKFHSKVHLMGLITEDQSAHSSPEHWYAMLKFLDQQRVEKVYLHLFTDGRDSPQHAAIKILRRFENQFNHNHNHHFVIKIASISGRFYAMDRTKNWSRIEKVYNVLTLGRGLKAKTATEAIVQAYNRQETDEFISPTVICQDDKPVALIEDNDLVFFMNLRSDRARQLTKSFVQKEFNKKNPNSFRRQKWPNNLFFIALTDFGPDLDNVRTAYPSRIIKNSLPFILRNYRQLYIAETEKYAHVTFFFNGGYDHPVAGEKRIKIPSPEVKSYDLKPEMSADKITNYVLKRLGEFDFIVINFANPDMLGHTGNLKATIKGVEFIDKCLAKITNQVLDRDGTIVITADHGNAEEMINLKTGEIDTQHSTNPVPLLIVSHSTRSGSTSDRKNLKLRKNGILADVSPTILDLMNIKKPEEMTGASLIKK
ncbi:MAG: 2,3-bisphosphoglycerate-independent phosphoglycerate mutase [Patescibacteria group bacterium]